MDEYALLEVIGPGASRRVSRAIDGNGVLVAVNVLRETLADHRDVGARFFSEAGFLAGKHLPGIVRLHQAIWDDERLALAIHLVEGPICAKRSKHAAHCPGPRHAR
jgi:serine/threonine protein kinase